MKKLIFAVLLLLLLFTGFWFYSANRIENFIAAKLGKAEEELKKRGFELKTEGLSISGFPFHYEAKIKSPTITRADGTQMPLKSASLDGAISLISNLLGSKFTIKKQGDGEFVFGHMQRGSMREDRYVTSGALTFTFSAEEESYVEAMKNPFKALFEMIEKNEQEYLIGKKGVLHLENFKFANAENKTLPLILVENGDIRYAVSDIDENDVNLKFSGDIKGLDIDTLLMGSDSFKPGTDRSLKEIALLLSMPKPGKTNITFDLEAKIPSKEEGFAPATQFAKIPSFSFDLKNMSVINNFGTHTMSGLTALKPIVDDKRQLHHDLIYTFETSKEQFNALRNSWEEFLSNLPICQESTSVKQSPGCPVIKSLIPKFDSFGKITFHTDFDFEVNHVKDPLGDSKLNVRHADYFAEIYGLKSEGETTFTQPNEMNVLYKINLLNYQNLFQDLFSYGKKIEQFLPYLTEEAASLPKLSDTQLKLLLNYLKAISDEPQKELKDIRITVLAKGVDSFKIGTLTSEEFEKKTEELMQELSKETKTTAEKNREKIQ